MKLTLFDISIRTISINLKLLKLYLFTLRIIIKNQVMRRLLKRLLDCLNWKIKLKNSNLEQLLSLVRFLYFLKKVFSVNYLNNYIHSHSVDFYIEIDSTDTNYFAFHHGEKPCYFFPNRDNNDDCYKSRRVTCWQYDNPGMKWKEHRRMMVENIQVTRGTMGIAFAEKSACRFLT